MDPPESEHEEKAMVKAVIEEVAQNLGNTPTVCRASYVHPRVLETFPTGVLKTRGARRARRARLTLEERDAGTPGSTVAPEGRHERREESGASRADVSAGRVGEKLTTDPVPDRRHDMNDPVAILKRDHREVAQMLKTLEASKPGAAGARPSTSSTQALELHMEIEERDIYPVVQRVVGRRRPRKPASSTAWRAKVSRTCGVWSTSPASVPRWRC